MTALMDFLTNEHRDILCGLKRDRDKGILEETRYVQERAHVPKTARQFQQEFDTQLMQRHVRYVMFSQMLRLFLAGLRFQ